jgi:Bacterial DNA-binding protein
VARFLRDLVWSEAAAETRHRIPGWLLTRDPRRSTPDRRGWRTRRPETPRQRYCVFGAWHGNRARSPRARRLLGCVPQSRHSAFVIGHGRGRLEAAGDQPIRCSGRRDLRTPPRRDLPAGPGRSCGPCSDFRSSAWPLHRANRKLVPFRELRPESWRVAMPLEGRRVSNHVRAGVACDEKGSGEGDSRGPRHNGPRGPASGVEGLRRHPRGAGGTGAYGTPQLGVFEVRKRKPWKARNPRTGEKVKVHAKMVVTFKPGREMEERVGRLKDVPGDDQ